MTVSRSFAPVDDETMPGAAPSFPLWPFACLAYAERCSRDYAGYVARLSQADDALGLQVIADMNRAFFALIWGPPGQAMAATREKNPCGP